MTSLENTARINFKNILSNHHIAFKTMQNGRMHFSTPTISCGTIIVVIVGVCLIFITTNNLIANVSCCFKHLAKWWLFMYKQGKIKSGVWKKKLWHEQFVKNGIFRNGKDGN